MMGSSKISIITACLNSEDTIKGTIESVLNQTYSNIEYIIIDGGSTDRTLDIITTFKDKFQKTGRVLKVLSEPDNGIYDAFNKGIKIANGEWVAFIGSGDVYVEDAIELYVAAIGSGEIDLIYSNIEIIGIRKINSNWSWNRFRRKMIIPHVGALHNIKFFEKYGLFDTSYKIAGDYELLLRAKKELRTLKLNELTLLMDGKGISNANIKEVYKEATRAKIETAKVPYLMGKIDYLIWMIKHKVKKYFYSEGT